MNQETMLSLVSMVIGFLALTTMVASYRRTGKAKRMEDSLSEFVDVRRVVSEHQHDLQRLAFQTSPQHLKPPRDTPVYLLTRPGWIMEAPVPVSETRLELNHGEQSRRWESARDEASTLLPYLPGSTRRRATYSQALIELGGRKELFNGFVYRLLDVHVGDGPPTLELGAGRYFDYLDTGEVLAYEAARAWRAGKRDFHSLRLRHLLRDPFDFPGRVTSCGVITLTVRRSGQGVGAGFLLHRRNPKAGEVASGMLHAVPAGELAPSSIADDSAHRDLSLWRNIIREYAEEMLGVADARGKSGRPIDFDNDYPFSDLTAAAVTGAAECYFLGIGLDPLTWKPEILTVCVFDADVFDSIFRLHLLAAPVPGTDDHETEGTILMGTNAHGIPFEENQVNHYLRSDMRDAGRTCLSLAWYHRQRLGIA